MVLTGHYFEGGVGTGTNRERVRNVFGEKVGRSLKVMQFYCN